VDQLNPYFKTPTDVDLAVKERRYWLDVRGLVQKPAKYLVEAESSLDEVIGLAGGFIKETPPQYVRIHKGKNVLVLNLNQYYSQAFEHPIILGWLGGEDVFLQREVSAKTALYELPVRVIGEVKNPGSYNLPVGSDFVDTVVQAGGFTDKADLSDIELIRFTPRGKRSYDFSWKDLQNAPALEQGDIVMVHADLVSKTERHFGLWLAAISAIAGVITTYIFVAAYNKGRV
jgi:hypothetical protein